MEVNSKFPKETLNIKKFQVSYRKLHSELIFSGLKFILSELGYLTLSDIISDIISIIAGIIIFEF